MVIYDKASWHIDAGMDKRRVIQRFQRIFDFLNDNDLLSDEGKEIYEMGIDESCSLNERTVTLKGNRFLGKYYDEVMDNEANSIYAALTEKWKSYSLSRPSRF